MPIRPENRNRYPPDWPHISLRIRAWRAGWRCECRGECGSDHTGRCPARDEGVNPRTGRRITLTVAHLNHTPENCDEANLRAMCNSCHNAYDSEHRAQTRARTAAAVAATWMQPLFAAAP
jgi:hypothetical protein